MVNGWKETTLEEMAEFSNGRTSPKRFDSGKYDVFGSNGVIGLSDEINSEDNTIIIGRVGSYCGSLYFSKNKCWVTDNAIKANAKSTSDPFFLYYLLTTQKLNSKAAGSGQPLINQEILNSIEVTIPPPSEQKAIAAILSSFDDKIELLRRQNKTLEQIAQTIFKEWFGKFNIKNQKLKIKNETGLPEGWRMGTVNDVIERFSITYRCDQDDLSPKGKTPILDQGSNGLYGYTEREPDFQASTENPVVVFANHTCNMWFINYPFCAIQNIIPFRGNSEYSTFFVFYMTLEQISFIEYKGHWPDFEQKEYVIPKPDVAKRFAEIVKPLQYKIWNNNSQIQTLSKLRDLLLPKLMKGEIRVKKT